MKKTGMEANMGSGKVTHKTMTIKSNTKGVPEVSTKYGGKPVDPMAHRVEKGKMPR